jgi:hypothetical protein
MKRRMTATVTDAVAQLRATTAGLGEGYHSIRSWMGDWLVDSSLESMIPQVAASTAAQYDISVRQYFEFCTHASHTPWSDPFLLHLSTVEKGLWLSCWLHWQHDRGSSITQSCSGLRKFFEQNGQPIDFFDDPRLKQVKASTRPSAAAQLALRQRTEKSVVPIEFLWTVMHHFGPRESDVRSEFDRVKEIGLVAMVMYEYGYGLRIGNLAVSNGNSNHTLLCDHVIFHFADPDDANALPRAMYAHEVWQHGSEAWCSTSHLVSVTMTHPSGKNWGGDSPTQKVSRGEHRPQGFGPNGRFTNRNADRRVPGPIDRSPVQPRGSGPVAAGPMLLQREQGSFESAGHIFGQPTGQLCVPSKRLRQASQICCGNTWPTSIPLFDDKLARHLRHRPSVDGGDIP